MTLLFGPVPASLCSKFSQRHWLVNWSLPVLNFLLLLFYGAAPSGSLGIFDFHPAPSIYLPAFEKRRPLPGIFFHLSSNRQQFQISNGRHWMVKSQWTSSM